MMNTLPTIAPELLEEFYTRLGVTRRHPLNHHLVLPLPTPEQAAVILGREHGEDQLLAGLREREELLRLMDSDPLRHGYRPEVWADVDRWLEPGHEVLVMGGNRSTKTECCAWYSVRDMVDPELGGNRIWGFFHSSEQSSIRLQQPRVYRYLPPAWRQLGRAGDRIYVCYKEASGFANQTIILSNNSRAFFFNYKQDVSVLEGYEFDGAWADELIPRAFEEAIRYRLVTRRGRLLESFTPVQGYSLTVAGWMAGARILQSRPSPLLPGRNVKDCPEGHMPYEMECVNRKRRIFFFFTDCSPYGDPDNEMPAKLEGAPKGEVMIRAYGYPEKQIGNAFPKFSQVVQVIKRNPRHPWNGVGVVPPHPWRAGLHGDVPYPSIPPEGTNVLVMDPGMNKNHFIKWYHLTAAPEWVIVYREWPPMSTHGEWALPGEKPDGKPGPAQRHDYGMGVVDYKRLILEAEGWTWDEDRGWDDADAEPIEDRYIDSRLGGTEVPSADKPSSLIGQFEEEQYDEDGRLVGPSLVFLPAPGGRVLEGMQLLLDYFSYDPDRPVTVLNCPSWYVVDACEQSIYAYEEYTGMDGERGALKDVIDPDRYLVNADCTYLGPEALTVRSSYDEDDDH